MFLEKPQKYWELFAKYVKLSPEFIDIYTKMTKVNPAERITIDQIKKHPWFKGPVDEDLSIPKINQ